MLFPRKFLRPLLLVVMVVVIPATALANERANEKMRRDMLARDHDKCLVGCLANNNGAVCKLLCGCTVDALGELVFEDYVRLNIEMNSARISAEHVRMLTGVAQTCAAEVDRAFPGLAMPPAAEDGE